MNAHHHEEWALCGTLDPQAVVDTELFTDVIDMADFHQAEAAFLLGGWASETIVCRAVTCDSAGNNAAALKTADTLAAHATNNDNVQVIISVRGEDLPGTTNADRYIKFGIVSGSSSGGTAAIAVFGQAKSKPATAFDLSSIKEIETDND